MFMVITECVKQDTAIMTADMRLIIMNHGIIEMKKESIAL